MSAGEGGIGPRGEKTRGFRSAGDHQACWHGRGNLASTKEEQQQLLQKVLRPLDLDAGGGGGGRRIRLQVQPGE